MSKLKILIVKNTSNIYNFWYYLQIYGDEYFRKEEIIILLRVLCLKKGFLGLRKKKTSENYKRHS
jgi:hypothetical protein